MIRTEDGDYVLECHESGPEIVVYLRKASALVKPVFDLLMKFLKVLPRERHKAVSSVKLTHRRVEDGAIRDEMLMEISFPLSDDTVKQLNAIVQQTLQGDARQHIPANTEDGVPKS